MEVTAEILIKGVNVKICPRLEEYIASSIKAADPPHFRTNLHGERASVKAKVDRKFLELNSSTPHPSSTSKLKSKRAHRVPSMSKQLSSSSTICQSRSSSKSISISSSSPSPVDIINITTDSDLSDVYRKPAKRQKPAKCRKAVTLQTVVKQEQHSSMLAPTTIPPEERQWPSDYPILDIVKVLHSCKPPPQGTTVAQHFYSLTGVPFKSSTYYDAWSKWDKATQEQRDNVEECGDDDLWKDFAVQVPLMKVKLKVARQRVRRRQRTVEAKESDGSIDSDISSHSFNTTSSN